MIKSGTVSGGRYLIIIGGSTASVDESMNEALSLGQVSVLDHAFLPDIHSNLHDAILGERASVQQDAVAVLETETVAANVRAAELGLKGTKVTLIELRVADYEMSGKAIVLKVDTEKYPALAQRYNVMSIPNFVVLKNGKSVFQQPGLVDHSQMAAWLKRAA